MSENKIDLSWDILSIILQNRDESLQPILQILCGRQMANSQKIRLALYDGHTIWKHCIVINDDEFCNELLTPFTVIRINKYRLVAKDDDVLVLLIEDLSIIKNGDIVNQKLTKDLEESMEIEKTFDLNSLSSSSKVFASSTKSESNSIAVVKPNMATQEPSNVSIDPQMICPINVITPFYRTWTICAWVMSKSSFRSYSTDRGQGRFFHFDVYDKCSEIRIKCFNEECDRFFNLIETNRCYFIGKGSVRFISNKNLNTIRNDYEIWLDKSSFIHPCPLEIGQCQPKIRYKFVKITTIASLDRHSVIDVIGVIHSVNKTTTTFLQQNQKVVIKRDLVIVDDTKTKTILTLSHEEAENFHGKPGQIIVVKGAVVIECQGKKLVAFGPSMIEPELPETELLKKWYQALSEQDHQQFSSLCRLPDQKTDETIQFTFIGNFVQKIEPESLQYSNVRCKIIRINRAENHFYKSCPCCSKKLSDDSEQYYCIHCDFKFNKFNWRMMLNIEIADWSGSIWLVAFYDLCEILLQKSIEELVKLYQDNIRCYRKLLIQKLLYHTFNFRIKSRRELYEGEYRIRHILESVLPDDDDKSIHETYIKSIKFLNENV